ncbi:AsnC family transcriptional regulator [Sulfitobacter sp. M39]|jgi:DNA-binding Lrp family transcriptional regulator|uniref:Lrp/AsnC family transcriptional regulator n=1 Tax=Sulfitobacter sp. M39 TaxID=2675334 RepID=UPI001F8FCBEB|nr:Lrp/AsnC family transcriptional regulator [Sulfitobacter sp. M39]MCF7748497.1 AsnC family transcriptional regulator [Sulfitobacter sp. M39]
MSLDGFDIAILRALQQDGAMTNTALSEKVNLSPSQCSRRRAALEAAQLISGYSARLNADRLGFGLRAIVRVNLRSHGGDNESGFANFIARHPEVRAAFSVSGDADYILDLRAPDLESFARFIHEQLLPHELVAQVRSEIVLRTLKDAPGVDLSQLPSAPR